MSWLSSSWLVIFTWLVLLLNIYCVNRVLTNLIAFKVLSDVGFYRAAVNTLLGLCLYLHVYCVFSDPGCIPKNLPKYKSSFDLPVCQKCPGRPLKPLRAHHCRTCRGCIFKMDHHCRWINMCVGYRNQKHFVLFLLYSAASSVVLLASCCYGIYLYTTTHKVRVSPYLKYVSI